ncbi:hypothetical protein ACFWY9_21190 [Amycolatopsis sp. NPDC059027]|uniref:hypothetical protein n=1 Tax=Amycolatopsis sp. NPDC059027 TaxID=3346709 RepID=UPI00366F0F68
MDHDDPIPPQGMSGGAPLSGDEEYHRPSYLVAADDEIFGNDVITAPLVIGDADHVPRTRTMPVSIYLDENRDTERVQDAVEAFVRSAGGEVVERDEPVIGSWFRRLRARFRGAAASPLGAEARMFGVHALESRLVHSTDATVTATMMQNLAPVLSSLQPFANAVIRVGALLIVKAEGELMVHQLTTAQQLALDHQPELLKSPADILRALGLAEEPATAPLPAAAPQALLRSEMD